LIQDGSDTRLYYWEFNDNGFSSGDRINYIIEVKRNISSNYYQYGYFPGYYYRPPAGADPDTWGTSYPLDSTEKYGEFYYGTSTTELFEAGDMKLVDVPSGSEKSFTFNVPTSGIYKVETKYWKSSSDTVLYLDSYYNDDHIGLYSEIVKNLSAGSHTVKLAGYNGSAVNAKLISTKLTTQSLSLGGTDYIKDVSETWYQIFVPATGTYIIETSQNINSSDTFLHLYDGNFNQIAVDDDSAGNYYSRITISLGTGNYYVKVRHYSNGQPVDAKVTYRQ
jgi:hypothetical protein